VRIISNGVSPASAPIPFEEFGIDLVFTAHPSTVFESKDGRMILCATRQREANATLRSVLRTALEAGLLAAQHPADPADVLPHIDELGIIEFKPMDGTFQPARLIRLPPETERFEMLLHSVARNLGGSKPPPPSMDCPHCSDHRAGDKVPA
jgi:hypothetical protein